VIAPGFFDIQSHSRAAILAGDGRVLSKVTQGVTTEIMGEGWTNAPSNEKTALAEAQAGRGAPPPQFSGSRGSDNWLETMAKPGASVNFGSFTGAATPGVPTAAELRVMQRLMRETMESGRFGLASALIYPPGEYATTAELTAIAKAMAPYGGVYITHMRPEAIELLEAIDEAIAIARGGGVPVEIYHLKAGGTANWGKIPQAIATINAARAAGMQVSADMVPVRCRRHRTHRRTASLGIG